MDDNIPSVFHFDQTDHHDHQGSNLLSKPTFEDCRDARQRRKASQHSFAVNDDHNPTTDSYKKGKIIHRDIERQRRQEMSTLYRDLRSLLPSEYLKGKRSISDHMQQAVKYIKDLQNKIQELGEKRDKLRRLSDTLTNSSSGSECLQSHHREDRITVRPCFGGVEVDVSTGFKNGLPLSRVLEVLIGEGLSIVHCISTQINEMLLHSIKSEVNDGRSVDFHELQQKIMKLTSRSLD